MVYNYLPTTDLFNAPAVIRDLRRAFDVRLEKLHAAAVEIQSQETGGASRMVQVPFRFEQYEVEALYDSEQDLFTQLVAKPIEEEPGVRPAYTMTLFLVGQ